MSDPAATAAVWIMAIGIVLIVGALIADCRRRS